MTGPSLQRARDLVRARAADLKSDLTVHLASGPHRRSSPLAPTVAAVTAAGTGPTTTARATTKS